MKGWIIFVAFSALTASVYANDKVYGTSEYINVKGKGVYIILKYDVAKKISSEMTSIPMINDVQPGNGIVCEGRKGKVSRCAIQITDVQLGTARGYGVPDSKYRAKLNGRSLAYTYNGEKGTYLSISGAPAERLYNLLKKQEKINIDGTRQKTSDAYTCEKTGMAYDCAFSIDNKADATLGLPGIG
jgi:hypothetical protein